MVDKEKSKYIRDLDDEIGSLYRSQIKVPLITVAVVAVGGLASWFFQGIFIGMLATLVLGVLAYFFLQEFIRITKSSIDSMEKERDSRVRQLYYQKD